MTIPETPWQPHSQQRLSGFPWQSLRLHKTFIQGTETQTMPLNTAIQGLFSPLRPSLASLAPLPVPDLAAATRPDALYCVNNGQLMAPSPPDQTTQSSICIFICTRCIPTQLYLFLQLERFHSHSLINKGNTVGNPTLQIYSHCLFSSAMTEPTGQDTHTYLIQQDQTT